MIDGFWEYLDSLIKSSRIIIDRPKGSCHPHFPEIIYPMDYGYLEGTQAMDGGGIDLFLGSLPEHKLTAVIMTIDLYKKDAELKLMIGCTGSEIQSALLHLNGGPMRAMLVNREYHEP